MTLTTLTSGEPWMTPQERELNHEFIRGTAEVLATLEIHETPLVTLRVNDIVSTWLLARRLESILAPTEDDPAPCPSPAQAGAIGKCRERLRRAIKELDQWCAQTGKSAPHGFVEQMHETIQKIRATGLLNKDIAPGDNDAQETDSLPPETPDNPNPEKKSPMERRHPCRQTTGDTPKENANAKTSRTTSETLHPEKTDAPGRTRVPPARPRDQVPRNEEPTPEPRGFLRWSERSKAPPRRRPVGTGAPKNTR